MQLIIRYFSFSGSHEIASILKDMDIIRRFSNSCSRIHLEKKVYSSVITNTNTFATKSSPFSSEHCCTLTESVYTSHPSVFILPCLAAPAHKTFNHKQFFTNKVVGKLLCVVGVGRPGGLVAFVDTPPRAPNE